MSWKYLDDFLVKLSKNSTLVGKYWVITLLLLRMIVLTVLSESVWSDERREFTCNTKQPGCDNVCFNQFAPVSNVRLWGLQILGVSIPPSFYFVYVLHALSKEKERHNDNPVAKPTKNVTKSAKGNLSKTAHGRWKVLKDDVVPNKVQRGGRRLIWRFYVGQIVIRVVIEFIFVTLQCSVYVYRWSVPEVHRCSRWPCPHTVDCFVSRPREKTIFVRYMFAMSILSIVLSVVELGYIAWVGAGSRSYSLLRHRAKNGITRLSSDFELRDGKWRTNHAIGTDVRDARSSIVVESEVIMMTTPSQDDEADAASDNFATYL